MLGEEGVVVYSHCGDNINTYFLSYKFGDGHTLTRANETPPTPPS